MSSPWRKPGTKAPAKSQSTLGDGFQSTPPRGGRQMPLLHTPKSTTFQSTPPRGGRRCLACDGLHDCRFQSTPPRGGRPSNTKPDRVCNGLFQSTPPRGGRRLAETATEDEAVFQSTPPRGGRPICVIRSGPESPSFNPRPRVGGDTVEIVTGNRIDVSIHAPAWGATP